MKKRRQYQGTTVGKRCLAVIYGLIAVTLALVCLIQAFSPYKDMWFGSARCSVWDMGWIYEREDGTDIRVSLPTQLDVGKAASVRLYNTIPSSYGLGQVLCIRSSLQDITLEIDGEEFAQYTDADYRLLGGMSASAWLFIQLPADSAGKTLTLVMESKVPQYLGKINEIYLGDEAGIMLYLVQSYGMLVFTGVLVVLAGIVFLVLHLLFRKNLFRNRQMLYLSGFFILFGAWILCESKIRQFYAGNLQLLNSMAFFMVMLMPIPLLWYCNEIEEQQYEKLFFWGTVVYAANFFVNLFLVWRGLKEFVETTAWTNTLLVLGGILCLWTMICSMKEKKRNDVRVMLVGCGTMVLFGGLDLFQYWCSSSMKLGAFSCVGILLFMVLVTISSFQKVIEVTRQRAQATQMSKEKTDFMSDISREVNPLLQTIQRVLKQLGSQRMMPEQRACVDTIQTAAVQISGVMERVRDYTDGEDNELILEECDYEFVPYMRDILSALQYQFKDNPVRLLTTVDPTIPSVLFGDEVQVRRLIFGVLGKVLADSLEGTIRFSLRFAEVDGEEGAYVMELYINEPDAFQKSMVSEKLLEILHAELEVRTEYGLVEGTLVRLRIPQVVRDWTASNFRIPPEMKAEGSMSNRFFKAPKAKIMLVDDRQVDLLVEKTLLERYGTQFALMQSGQQAIDYLEEHRDVDLVMIDMDILGMDAAEFVTRLRAIPDEYLHQLPVIAMLNDDDLVLMETALREGMNAWIVKPFNMRYVDAVMRMYLPREKKQEISILELLQWQPGEREKEEEGYKKLVASLEGINVSQGLRYCVYRMPVYIAALRIFVNLEWMDKLNYYLNKDNLKKYGESLHYVKRCARSIGAQEFADWSLAMSNAVKRGDLAYLQENEQEFMKSYQHIHDVVKKALQSYDEERL